MTGALLGTGLLPLEKEVLVSQLRDIFPDTKLALNLEAFTQGVRETQKA